MKSLIWILIIKIIDDEGQLAASVIIGDFSIKERTEPIVFMVEQLNN